MAKITNELTRPAARVGDALKNGHPHRLRLDHAKEVLKLLY